MPEPIDEIAIPARIVADGRDFPLGTGVCDGCKNRLFYIDLPEFYPSYCAFCCMKFVWFRNGETGRDHHVSGMPIEARTDASN